jgi:chemotaxis signal transduction protein
VSINQLAPTRRKLGWGWYLAGSLRLVWESRLRRDRLAKWLGEIFCEVTMIDRVVIVRVHDHLLSLPFTSIDEILGIDRVVSLDDLPEDAAPKGADNPRWVYTRGDWLPVELILPASVVTERSQIVIVRRENVAGAYMVDQVLGIESPGGLLPFPEVAVPFTNIPIAGVRLWKSQPVLELDLSRLISLDLGDR